MRKKTKASDRVTSIITSHFIAETTDGHTGFMLMGYKNPISQTEAKVKSAVTAIKSHLSKKIQLSGLVSIIPLTLNLISQ